MKATKILKKEVFDIDCAAFCDLNKSARVIDPEIHHITTPKPFFGIARTVSCDSDFLGVIKALSIAQEGDVLIVDGKGKKIAYAGELFATEAARRGLSAIIVDGAYRDSGKLDTIGIPILARYTTPMAGTTIKPGSIDCPVSCGGVVVHPGEYIIGDEDGVIVLTATELEEQIERAKNIQTTENKLLDSMADGTPLFSHLNFDEHYSRIQKGLESKLAIDV